jgi:adenylosuccinate synthase
VIRGEVHATQQWLLETPRGFTEFPADLSMRERATPTYEWMPGWTRSTADARRIEDLPAEARRHLDRMHEMVEAPISYLSVGTRRDQIIGL